MGTSKRRASSALAAVGLAALGVLSPIAVGTASAADYCGEDYYKQSDGSMGGQETTYSNGRRITSKTGGWVRFCSKQRTGLDHKNKRVLVGVPTNTYSTGDFYGGHYQTCQKMVITVRAKNVPSGSTIGISGTALGFSKSTSNTVATATRSFCDNVSRMVIQPSDFTFTVPACSYPCLADPEITSVRLTSVSTMKYYMNGAAFMFDASGTDIDYPN